MYSIAKILVIGFSFRCYIRVRWAWSCVTRAIDSRIPRTKRTRLSWVSRPRGESSCLVGFVVNNLKPFCLLVFGSVSLLPSFRHSDSKRSPGILLPGPLCQRRPSRHVQRVQKAIREPHPQGKRCRRHGRRSQVRCKTEFSFVTEICEMVISFQAWQGEADRDGRDREPLHHSPDPGPPLQVPPGQVRDGRRVLAHGHAEEHLRELRDLGHSQEKSQRFVNLKFCLKWSSQIISLQVRTMSR